jgi:hypothetical protein
LNRAVEWNFERFLVASGTQHQQMQLHNSAPVLTLQGWPTCSVSAAAWIAAGLGYVILEAIAAAGFQDYYSDAHNFISAAGASPVG